MTDSNLMT